MSRLIVARTCRWKPFHGMFEIGYFKTWASEVNLIPLGVFVDPSRAFCDFFLPMFTLCLERRGELQAVDRETSERVNFIHSWKTRVQTTTTLQVTTLQGYSEQKIHPRRKGEAMIRISFGVSAFWLICHRKKGQLKRGKSKLISNSKM